jgi:hypothetical protein
VLPASALLLSLLLPSAGAAVELRDGDLAAGASPVLENDSGTVRLEQSQLDGLGRAVFVPEPGGLWQLGAGITGLVLLHRRRRRADRPRLSPARRETDPAERFRFRS